MDPFGGDIYRPYSSSGASGPRRGESSLGLSTSSAGPYGGRRESLTRDPEAGPSHSSAGSSSASPGPSSSLPPMLPSPTALFGGSSAASTSATTPSQHAQKVQDASGQTPGTTGTRRVGGKANVASACGPCKRAHLACDVGRPCKRCINMGKQDQCEDVPHKKRGRPKASRASMGDPYSRTRQPLGGPVDRYRAAPYNYLSPVPPGYDTLPYPGRATQVDNSLVHYPPPRAPPPELDTFTVIATTDLRVARASASSFTLTGYHPEEFFNLSILDWVHPADRALLETERKNLVTVPFLPRQLVSDRDVLAALTRAPERELRSPAEGMREYPNQNVRVLRTDSLYSVFNARLHLGGGLGASLWRPATLGRVYIVISFLLMNDRVSPHAPPPPVVSSAPGRGEDSHRHLSPRVPSGPPITSPGGTSSRAAVEPYAPYPPPPHTQRPLSQPTRSSPTVAPAPEISPRTTTGQGLPSFSSIAGGITLPPLTTRTSNRSVSPLPYRPTSRDAHPLDRYQATSSAPDIHASHLAVPHAQAVPHAPQSRHAYQNEYRDPAPLPPPPAARESDYRAAGPAVSPYGYPGEPRPMPLPRRDSLRDDPYRPPPYGDERPVRER